VTKPTLFLAGEAGAEEVAFSGAGKRFGGGGGGVTIQGGISISISGVQKSAKELAREIAVELPRAINRLNAGGSRNKMRLNPRTA
jgi:hypothetical protein